MITGDKRYNIWVLVQVDIFGPWNFALQFWDVDTSSFSFFGHSAEECRTRLAQLRLCMRYCFSLLVLAAVDLSTGRVAWTFWRWDIDLSNLNFGVELCSAECRIPISVLMAHQYFACMGKQLSTLLIHNFDLMPTHKFQILCWAQAAHFRTQLDHLTRSVRREKDCIFFISASWIPPLHRLWHRTFRTGVLLNSLQAINSHSLQTLPGL